MRDWEVLFVALFIAVCHFISPYIHQAFEKYRAAVISFTGGLAISYVFLHLIPELEAGFGLVGNRIYFIALVGFIVFFGIELIMTRYQEPAEHTRFYVLHISVAFIYTALTIFTLGMQLPTTSALTVVFALSLGLHLMSNDIGLQENFGSRYVRNGRYLLILAVVLGSVLSIVRRPHEIVIDSLTAILAGFMLYKIFRDQLPEIQQVRYLPFIAGIGIFLLLHILLDATHR